MIAAAATEWGRAIGRYGRFITTARSPAFIWPPPREEEPCIWIGWHEFNLITIAAHRTIVGRPVAALTMPGLSGQTVQGWLEAADVKPITLCPDFRPGTALRTMRSALREGCDILIAVDGPSGPRRQVKPGALSLATLSGAPVRPVGAAARPALRLPRWDRHAIPLPGSRIQLVAGEALHLSDNRKNPDFTTDVATMLNRLADDAVAALRSPGIGTLEEVT